MDFVQTRGVTGCWHGTYRITGNGDGSGGREAQGLAKIVERVIHSAERRFDSAGMLRSPPEARFHITRLLLMSAYAHQLCVLEPTYPARTLSSRRPSMWARSAPAAPWCYRIWYGRPGGHPAESEAGPYD